MNYKQNNPNYKMKNNTISVDAVHASVEEEFYYIDTDLPVTQGDHIGYDVEFENSVELVLNQDVYWSPIE
jgi:hypothetical protein